MKQSQSLVRNQQGMSLLETLLGATILIIIMLALASFLIASSRQLERSSLNIATKERVRELFASIQNDPSKYQRYFSCVVEAGGESGCPIEDSLLAYSVLPMAVRSNGDIVLKSDCPTCQYRLGYLLYPSGTTSFLKLIVRVSGPQGVIMNLVGYVGN